MIVRSITIKNIRSFREEVIFNPHPDMNVLIGSNGSGKSNLMDVIYIMLKNYVLYSYQCSRENIVGGTRKRIDRQHNTFGLINQVLPKYIGCDAPCLVKFVLEVTEGDCENLATITKEKEIIRRESSQYITNDNIINNYLSREIEMLGQGEQYEYVIDNYTMKEPTGKAKAYLDYLRVSEGVNFICQEIGIRINPLLLYISPFRSINNQIMEVSLASSTFYGERSEVTKSYSRSTSSLIKLATLFFSEKRREYESTKEGYLNKWNNDKDVRFVTEALGQVGYTWDLYLKNKNKNTYIIQLKKDGQDFSLDQASSGEVELINFILGLITIGLKGGLIIVDEPELHLHPQWLGVLRGFFMRYGKTGGNQLMVVTHSSTFINSSTYPYISRVYKNQNGSSCIHQVAGQGGIETKQLLHFINATNNEKIFFSDFVVMVEGDTDEIVFKRILSTIKRATSFKENVEVMQIRGKSNFEKYSAFMKTLEIGSCFIGDLDNICEFSKGNEEIKNLLVTNEKRVVKDVLHNPAAMDNVQLVNYLKEAIETGDREKLQSLYDHIISIRTKLKQGLTQEERERLDRFIESLYPQNIYILMAGDIEAYFPEEYKHKDLDNVLEITGEKYSMWQQQDGFKALRGLMEIILHRNGILK